MRKLFFTLSCLLAAGSSYAQCHAQFSAMANPVNNVFQMLFINTSTHPAGGSASASTSYIDFGDGQGVYSTEDSIDHTYQYGGNYTAVLHTVFYADSTTMVITCSDSAVLAVNVGSTNDASAMSSSYMGNNVIDLFASLPAGYNPNASYIWYFGDGGQLFGPSDVAHQYCNPGTYIVTFTTIAPSGFGYMNHFSVMAPDNITTISGNIYMDSATISTTLPDSTAICLMRYDSATSMLQEVARTSHTGAYLGGYSFTADKGTYLVEAIPYYPTGTVGSLLLVPTYSNGTSNGTPYWDSATIIDGTVCSSMYNDVHVQFSTGGSGPAAISGNVSLGANTNTNAGVPNLLIFLRNANNQLVGSTYTDADGNFSFTNLPLGTYSVYPESMNYASTAFSGIVLDDNSIAVNDVNFNQDNSQHNIMPRSTGISNTILTANGAQLFPNPAKGNVTLSWNDTRLNNGTISMSNVAGQIVYKGSLSSNDSKVISISNLNAGIYFVRITGVGVTTNKKLMVE